MAWYKSGSANLTNGQQLVTGNGTQFLNNAKAGDIFICLRDGLLYEIAELVSQTQLLLVKPYGGTTVSEAAFEIIPTTSYMKTLAQQVTDLIALYNAAPQNLEDARAAADAAQVSATQAQSAATSVSQAAVDSQAAKTAAVQAQTSAEAAQTAAATSAANAANASRLTVGTVDTSAATAEVTITGSAGAQVVNFKIPRGAPGDMSGSKNLSDLADVAAARTNLGLGNVNNTSDANKPISTATQAALDNKVDKVTGKGLSTTDYTAAEKAKLASLNEHFKGTYTSLAALKAAVPSAIAGDYAVVDAGTGDNATQYNWDTSDTKWVQGGGVVTSTDVVPEGTSNLYYTAARVNSLVGSYGIGTSSTAAAMTDLDSTSTLSGIYFGSASTVGTFPTGVAAQNCMVIHRLMGAEGVQTLFLTGSDNVYLRRRTGGTWAAWTVMATKVAEGGGQQQIFYGSDPEVTENCVLDSRNHMVPGPLVISATLTINGRLVIV